MTLPAYAMNQSNFAEMYERWIVGPLFKPWAEILLDRAQLTASESVLDIACGTGIVARLALQHLSPNARVVGVDLSPEMLAVARSLEPAADWREGNVEALPLQSGESFDVVLCQQGLQFFSDKPAACREMKRALKNGGRLALAVWTAMEENPLLLELHRVAERRFGPFVDHRHSFGDPVALERLLVDAGFKDVRVERVVLPVLFSDPAMFVRLTSQASVGMSPACAKMTAEERASTAQSLAEENAEIARRYTDSEGLKLEVSANLATARI
jgi:ubiquinone/menaquinone biosynthesis C-methylase UbiE